MAETLINVQPELNKQVILRNLSAIADADVARSIDSLEAFVYDKAVLDGFGGAIKMFGSKEEWTGSIYRGSNNIQSKYLAVSLEQPPFLEGGSFLHAYSIDYGQPSFGVLIPFDVDGRLDRTRPTSAKWMMDERLFVLNPYEPLRPEYEVRACERISWVIQMAAAETAGFIEREWPSTLDEQLAAL